ncbi:alpha/beta hydrolase [uncultured Parasphingopyxis sp.]|uniref:alpha/beta hydrolase family protein n=1 Tax=uncultured Parasphingopyxis sp. TaxID=1547918 RepID=UPI00263769B3|nr:alpha/beta hydrolase [uncultured Parasphingopyxis sp.]
MLDESHVLDKVERRFIGFPSPTAPRIQAGGHPCQGIYWTPKGNPNPKVALIATHYNVDFTEHYIAPYFAARGYGFLGWNTRYRGFEDLFALEHALIDIGVGVDWLREQGVETLVILGNSGGGSLMGAYQAEAIAPTLDKDMEGPGAEVITNLGKADLYIALNAHQGRPEVLTAWMDASVVDEWDPVQTDESLNPFNPDNGPPYSDEFIARYRKAQRARNQKITDWAKAELKRVNDAGIPDRLFPLFRCWGDLRFMDPAIDPSERKPQHCYRGYPPQANKSPSIGRFNMLKAWLSMWSLETSKCQGGGQLAKFDNPSLVVQGLGDAGVFPSDAQALYDFLGCEDKQLEMVKGQHYFEDSVEERDAVADLMADWIAERA